MKNCSPAFRIIKGGAQPAFDEESESDAEPLAERESAMSGAASVAP